MHLKAQRYEARRVGADTEKGDVSEAELARVAKQQIEAHGGDDENAGHDQDVQHVEVRHPQRQKEQHCQQDNGGSALHPMRSRRANSPVGLTMRMTMIRRKPMPSRKPEEM